ncbi:hypothetical protein OQA88_8091 [Cercophora sp. LCS_1]
MAGKKIITVFGATGAQGGSVANIFLHDPKLKDTWTVRAVTRDVTKPAAKKLQEQGAEVVSADINDKASLVKAMQGAYAVYAVTNYWEKMDKDLEIAQGHSLVDAARETGVQHFIWSSLRNVTKLSNGQLPNVYHFDSKALVEDYARASGIPSTFFMPGFYMSNLPGSAFRNDNGTWTFSLPIPETAQIPMFDTADTGKFIKAIALHRDEVLGKRVLGATEYMTGKAIVEGFKKVFPEAGKTARYQQLPEDVYVQILKGSGMPDFVATELLENMVLMDRFGYYGGESLDWSHGLVEDNLTSWEKFAKKSEKWAGLK